MSRKKNAGTQAGATSGLAGTLFPLRTIAPLETPGYRQRAGELIARAALTTPDLSQGSGQRGTAKKVRAPRRSNKKRAKAKSAAHAK